MKLIKREDDSNVEVKVEFYCVCNALYKSQMLLRVAVRASNKLRR